MQLESHHHGPPKRHLHSTCFRLRFNPTILPISACDLTLRSYQKAIVFVPQALVPALVKTVKLKTFFCMTSFVLHEQNLV